MSLRSMCTSIYHESDTLSQTLIHAFTLSMSWIVHT